jgi:Flp pilus assembly pilin Flp
MTAIMWGVLLPVCAVALVGALVSAVRSVNGFHTERDRAGEID